MTRYTMRGGYGGEVFLTVEGEEPDPYRPEEEDDCLVYLADDVDPILAAAAEWANAYAPMTTPDALKLDADEWRALNDRYVRAIAALYSACRQAVPG